jgi:hypothetical protein
VRGFRPWDQFLNYCNTIAQHRGGRLYAAQLTDPRYFPFIEQKLAESKGKSSRPGLEGYTAVEDWLRVVANEVRALTGALTHARIEFIDGPEGPADLIKARYQAASDALLLAALGH